MLAMASQPSFDPDVFNAGVSNAQWREWTRNRATPLINKATNRARMRRARPSR
ncbi:hypothetical protein [Dankookia sp. P2]|uniref:hypothetical protein n=1 Tax=Dankookia sp. P2 TaxID=3423955 RepID=UPI003D66714A